MLKELERPVGLSDSLPECMRAAVARERGAALELATLPVPVPREGELLVRVLASGVCHTDIHAIDGDWPVRARLPLIPGHEAVGEVAALGPGVEGFGLGDRVGVFWLNAVCGRCEHCLGHHEMRCQSQRNTGYTVPGTFAEYCTVSAGCAVPLPPHGDPVQLAPVMCAGVTTWKGLQQMGAPPGAWVVISGVGGIGHLAVQYAVAMGLRVVAVDVDDRRLELAAVLGAEHLVNADRDPPVNRVLRATGGGAAGALITANQVKAAQQALAMLRRGGVGVLVGIPAQALELSVFDIVVRELTLRGSIVGSRDNVLAALAYAVDGSVRSTIATRPLARVNEAIDDVRQRRHAGRVVLTMT
jgi:propanol-preferring alcohol dehydrogenase